MHALMCTSSPESARELCTNRPIEMHYLFLRGVAARVASLKWRARCTLPARAGSAQRRRQKRPCVLPSSECVLGGAACEMLLELPAVRLGKRLVVGRSNASVLLFDTCTLSPQHDDNGSSMPRTWLALGPLFYAARTGPGSGVRLGEPYDGGSLQADERVRPAPAPLPGPRTAASDVHPPPHPYRYTGCKVTTWASTWSRRRTGTLLKTMEVFRSVSTSMPWTCAPHKRAVPAP